MIFYHGTPIGGTREDARKFLKGKSALVSYAHPAQLPIVQDVCDSYVIDNGAFSIWRKGGKLNPHEFYKWLEPITHHHGYNFCLIPDVIDGSEKVNNKLIDEFPKEFSGVPIWHLNESLGKLEYLSAEWHTVAFGSAGNYADIGDAKWWARIAEAMEVICDDGTPRCHIHGLRMAAPACFTQIPFASVDSTNCAQNAVVTAKCNRLPETWMGAEFIWWRLSGYQPATEWSGCARIQFRLDESWDNYCAP